MGTGTGHTRSHLAERPFPDASQSLSFGADTLLVTSFAISLGIPGYYTLGLVADPSVVALYAVSAALLPSLTPVLTWWARWGRPRRREASAVVRTTFAFVVPGLVLAVAVVGLGFEMALLGVGVMAFVAMLIMQVVSRRFGTSGGLPRMDGVRLVCVIATPAIVLGLTNTLPNGIDAIGGWSIPMLVAAMGAIGSGWGLKRAVGPGRRGMNSSARHAEETLSREESHDGRTSGARGRSAGS